MKTLTGALGIMLVSYAGAWRIALSTGAGCSLEYCVFIYGSANVCTDVAMSPGLVPFSISTSSCDTDQMTLLIWPSVGCQGEDIAKPRTPNATVTFKAGDHTCHEVRLLMQTRSSHDDNPCTYPSDKTSLQPRYSALACPTHSGAAGRSVASPRRLFSARSRLDLPNSSLQVWALGGEPGL
jgi:hypothetical protein